MFTNNDSVILFVVVILLKICSSVILMKKVNALSAKYMCIICHLEPEASELGLEGSIEVYQAVCVAGLG